MPGITHFGSMVQAPGFIGAQQAPGGKTFYVNPAAGGADDRDVPWWDVDGSVVFSTLQGAIDACVDYRGDIIYVKRGNHGVTEAVTFDKAGISVFAQTFGHPAEEVGESFTVNAAASYDDGPAAIITAPCRIIGLGFAGRSLTEESLLIDCQEAGGFSGGFIELINCRFSVWYGAIAAGVRMIGGAVNKLRGCSFDGLFGGFGTAGIILENDAGGLTPAYTEVVHCVFQGVGSGKHAIKHATGSTPYGFFYAHNRLLPGFLGNYGKFLDNNSVVSKGMCADNWLAPLANQAAAFENLGASVIGFADNHYEEA
jgi:hypothetical protein